MNAQSQLSKYSRLSIILLGVLVAIALLSSCTDQCTENYTYIEYTPQYRSMESVRTSVDILPPQPVEKFGKIYLHGTTLFITEPDSGIHVINNADPSNPVSQSFINLPGAHDVATKGNYLYADSFLDLVVFDITDKTNITEVKRVEDVFTNHYYYVDNANDVFLAEYIETNKHVMDAVDCDQQSIFYEDDVIFMLEDFAASSDGGGGVSGISGSMARMNVVDNHLYGIDSWSLHVLTLDDPSCPELIKDVDVGWNIETIFPYEQSLFIGAADGMYIFDNTVPTDPQFRSKFEHARACDPVVVQDDIAFVTLRNGTECLGFANQLDVVDVSDLDNPKLLYTHEMDNPHGLGVDGDNLFICEGEFGLKLFDKSDLSKIGGKLTNWIRSLNAYDVIPFNDLLIVIGEDGLYQFDYSNPEEIVFLSKIDSGS